MQTAAWLVQSVGNVERKAFELAAVSAARAHQEAQTPLPARQTSSIAWYRAPPQYSSRNQYYHQYQRAHVKSQSPPCWYTLYEHSGAVHLISAKLKLTNLGERPAVAPPPQILVPPYPPFSTSTGMKIPPVRYQHQSGGTIIPTSQYQHG
eukprot:3783246-Rhodomonas_salina.1